MSESLCICGLGNPGRAYAQHRHNLGVVLCQAILESEGQSYSVHAKTKVLHAIFSIAGVKVHIVQLPTYMNLSGQGLQPYLQFYQIPPQNVIIAHDELDIPFGQLRLKKGGGSGGHNGLKDLTRCLRTPEYWRIRIGIGRPPEFMEVADFVLSSLNESERKQFPNVLSKLLSALDLLVHLDAPKIQTLWHTTY